MEEENTNDQMNQDAEDSSRTRVGFPQQQPKEQVKFPVKLVVIIVVILLLLAGGWFFLIRPSSESITDDAPTPTPFTIEESTPTPTAEEINREGIRIQVLNGTGIAGAAGDLQEELEGLGYSGVEVGNASTQNYSASEVTFNEDVSEAVRDEIQNLLEDTFGAVEADVDSLDDFDIQIITGLPAGQTATPTKPAATATPTAKPTGSATSSPTGSSTPTPTP